MTTRLMTCLLLVACSSDPAERAPDLDAEHDSTPDIDTTGRSDGVEADTTDTSSPDADTTARPDGLDTDTVDTSSPDDTLLPADATDTREEVNNPSDLSCLRMKPLRLWTTEPSAVAMLYRIETCAGETVLFEPGPNESVFDYYDLTENGTSLSSEAVPAIDRSASQRGYVTLLLDFSSSTRAVEGDLIDSSKAFVEALLSATERAWIGIQIFDGRRTPVQIQLPTPDRDELISALESLRGYTDPAADPDSTNLNGAIATAVPALQQWQEDVIEHQDGGIVTSGFVVVFTDGRDTSDLVSTATAGDAVANAREANGANGQRSNVETYAVALRGTDFTSGARASLLEVLGGESRWLKEGSLSELRAQFSELALTIARRTEWTHLLKYCSAARAGEREVVFTLLPSRGTVEAGIRFSFSAEGFSAGCSTFIQSVCVDKQCGGFNCGGCDERRELCKDNGSCEDGCVSRNQCGGQTYTTPLGYAATCGPDELGQHVRSCAGTCRDTSGDPNNCGDCGIRCDVQGGAGEQCIDGACRCPGGGMVCAGACQPESFFDGNPQHCGSCGNVCRTSAGERCDGDTCACPDDGTVCAGTCREASFFRSSAEHCGSCGAPCNINAGQVCLDGSCLCPNGGTVCAGLCREPAFFQTSGQHCGSCGNACTGATVCQGGSCVCPLGQTFCAGQCRAPAYFQTTSNCGTCGNVCAGDTLCDAGQCRDECQIALGLTCAEVNEAYIKASNTDAGDRFGVNVKLSADASTMLVGAIGEDSAATTIGGNQASNSLLDSGAAYVFVRSGTTWAQQAYIKPPNGVQHGSFGGAIALSSDGRLAVIGGRRTVGDGAYVFERSGATWSQTGHIAAPPGAGTFALGSQSDAHSDIALSSDLSTLVIADAGNRLGAAGVGGDETIASANGAGAVYVYARDGAGWATTYTFIKASNPGANERFGRAIALSASGDTMAIGAYGEGSDLVGINPLGDNTNAPYSGAVYVFRRNAGVWTQEAYIKGSNPISNGRFGNAVALPADGNTLVVGRPGGSSGGAVFVFVRSGNTWSEQAYIHSLPTPMLSELGRSVSITADGANLVATGAASASPIGIGGAALFRRMGTAWFRQASFSFAERTDHGVAALSADGTRLALGFQLEGSPNTGIGSAQGVTGAANSGAVFVRLLAP